MNVLLCMGNRADVIKLAPVYHALFETDLQPFVLRTDDDSDEAWALYDFFGIEANHCLDLKRKRPSSGHLSAVLIDRIDALLANAPVGAVLVQGGASDALAAALAAYAHDIPLAHLQTGADPATLLGREATNHTIIARMARFHFAATPHHVRNLLADGIPENRIFYVRNTVVDATMWGMNHLLSYFAQTPADSSFFANDLIKRLKNGRTLFVDVNDDRRDEMVSLARALADLVEAHTDIRIVWPVATDHPARASVEAALLDLHDAERARILLLGALQYPQMLWLLKHSWLLLARTDRLQAESATLGVPTVHLRNSDEATQPAAGDLSAIGLRDVSWALGRMLRDEQAYARLCPAENPYGDGRSGQHIARILQREIEALHPQTRHTKALPQGSMVNAA